MTTQQAAEIIRGMPHDEVGRRAAELLAAAVDAVETFEAGGAMGGPVMRLRESVREATGQPDWTGRPAGAVELGCGGGGAGRVNATHTGH